MPIITCPTYPPIHSQTDADTAGLLTQLEAASANAPAGAQLEAVDVAMGTIHTVPGLTLGAANQRESSVRPVVGDLGPEPIDSQIDTTTALTTITNQPTTIYSTTTRRGHRQHRGGRLRHGPAHRARDPGDRRR